MHKPFTFYGFRKHHNNGKLCERVTEKIAQVTKPRNLWDPLNNKFKGHHMKIWWKTNYPVITVEFLDKNKKVINSDYIVHLHQSNSSARHSSEKHTVKIGDNYTYNSIITEDTENGWHPQDGSNTGTPLQTFKYSDITYLLRISANSLNCKFSIIENTNFLIVTKINKNIVKNTDKIIVKYSTDKPPSN